MHSQFLIGGFTESPQLKKALEAELDTHVYRVHIDTNLETLLQWIGQNRHRIDCLILEISQNLVELFETLRMRDILLPTLMVSLPDPETAAPVANQCQTFLTHYHEKTLCITTAELSQIEEFVHRSIDQFLSLHHQQAPTNFDASSLEDTRHFLLSLQQQRLAEKLRERLGYLKVFYKRNRDSFVSQLTPEERAKTFNELRTLYRAIVLGYFSQADDLNQKIDDFVNTAFFTNVSVSKVVEIHMELMDSFSKQLKLEGRSEEILLDYRLTLIDILAHLCEMYRRSIPPEV